VGEMATAETLGTLAREVARAGDSPESKFDA
jgi:hypothetical protein